MNDALSTRRLPSTPRRAGPSRPGAAAPRPRRGAQALAAVAAACLLAAGPLTARAAATSPIPPSAGPALATAPVQAASPVGAGGSFEGVVQAVRQTVVSAQVAGAVVELPVKAGDRVQAGQLLVRLDARAAEQQAGAALAQVQAARAAQDAATQEYERQKTLFQKNYISQAALERAEAQYKTALAEAAAQRAAAGAAQSQSGWYVLRAPYAGVVSDVPVVRGDMALPGRALVTMHDPSALRVSAQVPETVAARLSAGQALEVQLPGTHLAPLSLSRWELLPAVDPVSHTRELRIDLPANLAVAPGSFARASLPAAAGAAPAAPAAGTPSRLSVPVRAVVRRAELQAVYVVDPSGRALLRQVRLGRVEGDQVEVLSGVSAGERVALDPQAAARVR